MHKKGNHIAAIIATGVVIIVFPVISVTLLSFPAVTNFVIYTLKATPESFLGLLFDYFSIAITLLLGVIVYFQSKKINSLEATQYDVFIGVEDIDYEFDFGSFWATDKSNADFRISHMFTSSKKALLSNIDIGEGRGKTILLPLVFVTKNNPLIVKLDFQKVIVEARTRTMVVCDKVFEHNEGVIKTILADNSRLTFGFGLTIPEKYNIDEIHLQFDIELENQSGYRQKLQSSVSLCRIREDDDFVLTSSCSRYI